MRTRFFFLIGFFLAITLSAQNKVILKSTGSILNSNETLSSSTSKRDVKRDKIKSLLQPSSAKGINGQADTLSYFNDADANTNFGIDGQDWVVQWFVAPADMIIKSVGLSIAELPDTTVQLEVKLVKLNWEKSDIQNTVDKHLGYYPAEGSGNNNITAFQDNPDRTGDWIDKLGSGLIAPFAEDIWSDSGQGIKITPILKTVEQNYQWIHLDSLEEAVVVPMASIVGIAVRNLSQTKDSLRVGISAGQLTGFGGFKFYSNGRFPPGNDFGWWNRAYTFDFALAVEMGEGCGFIPILVTKLPTTLSTEPREVSAEVTLCSYKDTSKIIVDLNYSFDKGVSFLKTQMTTTDSIIEYRTYKGIIPGAQSGAQVSYYVSYADGEGNTNTSSTYTYNIFKPENFSLLVFNGFTKISGYPPSYYFGHNGATTDASEIITFPKDKWAYGALTKDLVDNYTNIFEITTEGPKDINNDVIKEWLAASPTHNYLLAGDEYLGNISGWRDSTYKAGDFQYDILGIAADHNDISYKVSGDQLKASFAFAASESELGDSLYLKSVERKNDSLLINPIYELGSTYQNWLDGFYPALGTQVDVTARGVDGKIYNVGAHRTLPAGNKIAFLAFDPLSLDSPPSKYFWYGFDRVSPLVQAMRWFGADVVGVEEHEPLPVSFQLGQNYPNPFNPNTIINYRLPASGKVSLKVYDVLGKEVAVLVNEEKEAGNYKIEFNGNNLASGIYFYTLRANNFVQSRKMILLK